MRPLALLLFVAACGSDAPAITGKEWQVAAIGGTLAPVGAGGRPLTMNFDYASGRVSGFAGCNQYNAPYVMTGDSLIFGPAVSTRMACIGAADSAERAFLTAIPAVATWRLQDSLLVLQGDGVAIRLKDGQN